MSEANDLIFDVGIGSSEVLRVDQEGDISFLAGSLRTVQCADLAAHVECRKELLALQLETINQGRTQFHAGLCGFVLGLGVIALIVFIFVRRVDREKGLRTTTDAQPGNPIIRVELPGVVRGRSY